MGILNVTPDSFSDGGQFTDITAAIQQAKRMIAEGVNIIDIGGESTRPGSESVSIDEQMSRVLPVISAIRTELSETVRISIDTTSSEVANAALCAGANIINDISAGQNDHSMLTLACEHDVPIVLMHMQGSPKTMQDNPHYVDVVAEVIADLTQRIAEARHAGIKNTILY
jgi:Dihydropteroate synthase (EC 2.5.1.15)